MGTPPGLPFVCTISAVCVVGAGGYGHKHPPPALRVHLQCFGKIEFTCKYLECRSNSGLETFGKCEQQMSSGRAEQHVLHILFDPPVTLVSAAGVFHQLDVKGRQKVNPPGLTAVAMFRNGDVEEPSVKQ